jgi:D-amino peptidase
MIEEGAKQALQNLKAVKPYVPAKPTTITIDLSTVDSAAEFMGRHGVEIVEPLKVVSRAEDWMTAWNQIWHW